MAAQESAGGRKKKQGTPDTITASVAKCRGSWVAGRGRGSWVNVMGKNKKKERERRNK